MTMMLTTAQDGDGEEEAYQPRRPRRANPFRRPTPQLSVPRTSSVEVPKASDTLRRFYLRI